MNVIGMNANPERKDSPSSPLVKAEMHTVMK
jgi:hypothetical protein